MALNTVSSDRLSTNVKNTNFTSAEKQDLTDDIKPLLGSSGGGNKNLIINGAMLVAQRGTSSTTNGYGSVDRFRVFFTGLDESPTQAQADVAAGTTPYTSGFRKCLKVTNGNQTSGAGAGDYLVIRTTLEAQDIANSGWNYTSSSSNVTLQFWIKSSVAQNFYGRLQTQDGTTYNFPFETGSLSADTWTKITKTISGNSNLTFNNDNGGGLRVEVIPFYGTDYTASPTLDTWAAHSSSSRTPDNTSTWYTTNDATLEITGLQLEVGSVATDFEHRSFAVEKGLCERYYQRGRYSSYCQVGTPGTYYFSRGNIPLFTPMRASVTGTLNAASSVSNRYLAYKTWADQTNVTAAPASISFTSNAADGGDGPHTDITSIDLSVTVSSGSSNSPLPANGPGANNVYPIEYYDVELDAEL